MSPTSTETFVTYVADKADEMYGRTTTQQFPELSDALWWVAFNDTPAPGFPRVTKVTSGGVDVPPPWSPPAYPPASPAGDVIDGGGP
jgi:hypothetical protein